jgi:alpha-beta hydrolase superfamily lysophospholipase
MIQNDKRGKIRSVLKWILWVLLVQFLLINISGSLYAYKLTYFYEPSDQAQTATSKNIFLKTWELFTGPNFHKSVIEEVPHFSYETAHLTTSNHLTLEGWYIPVDSSKGTVVLVHGMSQNKSMLLSEAYEFMYLGFNVMLIDLRAHGNSNGNVSTIGFLESEDVKLAYDYVGKKGERNIILYGVSLGATVITKAIYDYDLSPSRIILEMPFEKLERLFGKRGTMLGFSQEPFGALVTFWASVERGFNAFKVNTSKYAEKVKCPVLLQYGALDKIISAKETNSIFEHIASNNKKLVGYENADHEFFLNKDPLKWRKEIKDFLQ